MEENLEEIEKTKEMIVQENVEGITTTMQNGTTRTNYTTITDPKVLFNLENSCDFKINDCKGEKIRVCDILIKKFVKNLENPEIDEETGEIIKDKEITILTILVDDNHKTYVTKSKLFSYQVMRLLEMFPVDEIKKGIEIEICENKVKDSDNKSLGFILL